MQITKDRKKHVIDLHFNQHKTYAEIAQIEHISPRDIHAIIKEEIATRQKHKDQELSTEANKLFSEGNTTVQVATMLNLPASKVTKLHIDYLKLRGLDKLNTIYKETNGKIWPFLKLYKELIKKRHMSIEQVANVVEIAINKLPYMESLYQQAKDQAEKMQYTVQRLANDIAAKEYKISILDKTAFSIEQERKRTEQRVQKLGDKKDRLEGLIATMLSDDNEDYTKLKAIVKESVKAYLANNKQLISISFVALIQTLKADPQMVKLIQNIPSANDGEQYKDNNSKTIKYLETNKDRIIDLSKKNHENLIESLTNDSISNGITSSSNPTSLPQSSSTFQTSFDQIDTFRKEEIESFDTSKGDIAD